MGVSVCVGAAEVGTVPGVSVDVEAGMAVDVSLDAELGVAVAVSIGAEVGATVGVAVGNAGSYLIVNLGCPSPPGWSLEKKM
jgi:hypothetical protein